jgi:glyoxylase-like metal-dependent hydrolase (beta-lactamase superfamily II)
MTRHAADGTTLRSWQIGDVTITRIDELRFAQPPQHMFAGATADLVAQYGWLKPHFVDGEGQLRMYFNSFVVESEGRRIMVDTCVGNDKPRPIPLLDRLQTPYLETLNAAGFAPDSFDFVLCTHLHVDHVGWNTRWNGERWVPTFPRARYLFGRQEWEHLTAAPADSLGDFSGDSIRPVIEAGLCEFVQTDHRITSEVFLEHTPGHTPGHVSVRISSRAAEAVITGDLIHHPLQCAEPHLSTHVDFDPVLARETRSRFLRSCCGEPTLVIGSHFADPTGGWIIPAQNNWRFTVERPQPDRQTAARDKNK